MRGQRGRQIEQVCDRMLGYVKSPGAASTARGVSRTSKEFD